MEYSRFVLKVSQSEARARPTSGPVLASGTRIEDRIIFLDNLTSRPAAKRPDACRGD
jgi:hypothetical protein